MQVFKSKVDSWLAVVLCIPPISSVIVIVSGAATGTIEAIIPGVISAAVVAGIYGGLVFPMHYTVTQDTLIIRFGLASYKVPLASIRSVKPSMNPLSAPALSLRRLLVEYDQTSVLISPEDRAGFYQALQARTSLVPEGEGLVKK
jgi:hypothetical protein